MVGLNRPFGGTPLGGGAGLFEAPAFEAGAALADGAALAVAPADGAGSGAAIAVAVTEGAALTDGAGSGAAGALGGGTGAGGAAGTATTTVGRDRRPMATPPPRSPSAMHTPSTAVGRSER